VIMKYNIAPMSDQCRTNIEHFMDMKFVLKWLGLALLGLLLILWNFAHWQI